MPGELRYTETETRLGRVIILTGPLGLKGVWFHGQKHFSGIQPDWLRDDAGLAGTAAAVLDCIHGGAAEYSGPLDPEGTDFQRSVWAVLRGIPRGAVISYGEVARRAGRPAAVRAAGAAIGRNPISVIVPCHRVVGVGGALTGYAGGLDRKSALLEMERMPA